MRAYEEKSFEELRLEEVPRTNPAPAAGMGFEAPATNSLVPSNLFSDESTVFGNSNAVPTVFSASAPEQDVDVLIRHMRAALPSSDVDKVLASYSSEVSVSSRRK
jgi:hypothetical protein